MAKEGLLFDLYRVLISAPHCCEMGQNQLNKVICWRRDWKSKVPPSFEWDLTFPEKTLLKPREVKGLAQDDAVSWSLD